jgi:hypothetical protein
MVRKFRLARCNQHLASGLPGRSFCCGMVSSTMRAAYSLENCRADKNGKKQGYDVDTDAEEHGLKASKGVKSTGVHRRGIFCFSKGSNWIWIRVKTLFSDIKLFYNLMICKSEFTQLKHGQKTIGPAKNYLVKTRWP